MNYSRKPEFELLGSVEFEYSHCPVCDVSSSILKYEKKILNYIMRYFLCNSCHSLYANPIVSGKSLKNLYASEDFFEGKENNINYYSFLEGEPYLSKTAKSRLNRIMHYARGKNLLEVASAAGFFLNQAKNSGFNVQGVEISDPMARWSSARWKVPVIADSIEKIELPKHSYDVIAAWGVFTILRNPRSVLMKFHDALKEDGILAFNTYYTGSCWEKIWKRNWYILAINTSQILSQKALLALLHDAGFEIVSKKRDCPYASLRYLLFQFGRHIPNFVKNKFFDKIGLLEKAIIRVPAPDAYEYICIKRSSRGSK